LRRADPVIGVLITVYRIKKLKAAQAQQRAVLPQIVISEKIHTDGRTGTLSYHALRANNA
jgi:hypothetical protein